MRFTTCASLARSPSAPRGRVERREPAGRFLGPPQRAGASRSRRMAIGAHQRVLVRLGGELLQPGPFGRPAQLQASAVQGLAPALADPLRLPASRRVGALARGACSASVGSGVDHLQRGPPRRWPSPNRDQRQGGVEPQLDARARPACPRGPASVSGAGRVWRAMTADSSAARGRRASRSSIRAAAATIQVGLGPRRARRPIAPRAKAAFSCGRCPLGIQARRPEPRHGRSAGATPSLSPGAGQDAREQRQRDRRRRPADSSAPHCLRARRGSVRAGSSGRCAQSEGPSAPLAPGVLDVSRTWRTRLKAAWSRSLAPPWSSRVDVLARRRSPHR